MLKIKFYTKNPSGEFEIAKMKNRLTQDQKINLENSAESIRKKTRTPLLLEFKKLDSRKYEATLSKLIQKNEEINKIFIASKQGSSYSTLGMQVITAANKVLNNKSKRRKSIPA